MNNANTSYDVRIYKISKDPRAARRPFRLRWTVAGKKPLFSKYFSREKAAKNFAADLQSAINRGEAFDIKSGLPMSMQRKKREEETRKNAVTWLQHAREYAVYKWHRISGHNRKGLADVLRDISIAAIPANSGSWQPETRVLSEALRLWVFRPDTVVGSSDKAPEAVRNAIEWAEAHSPNITDVATLASTRSLLDALSRTRSGHLASANYFNRRRAVLYNVFAYAVTKERLESNPLDLSGLNWERPNELQSDDVIDPRAVGTPDQVEEMLTAVWQVGREQGPRYVAFFGCLYYAMMRPEEVVSLKKNQCELPESGWGRLILTSAAPATGRHWTDDGKSHEFRGLKHRGRKATRAVPIPPRLVELLRDHMQRYRIRDGARMFSTTRGNPIDSGVYGRVWAAARRRGLPEHEQLTPRLKRPYDLRHSGISLRRTAGVPSRQVAEWAGHSVAVLERVYSKVLDGYDDRWQRQIDDFMG